MAYSTDGARGATKLELKQFVWLTQRAARGNRVGVEAVCVAHSMDCARGAAELELILNGRAGLHGATKLELKLFL